MNSSWQFQSVQRVRRLLGKLWKVSGMLQQCQKGYKIYFLPGPRSLKTVKFFPDNVKVPWKSWCFSTGWTVCKRSALTGNFPVWKTGFDAESNAQCQCSMRHKHFSITQNCLSIRHKYFSISHKWPNKRFYLFCWCKISIEALFSHTILIHLLFSKLWPK